MTKILNSIILKFKKKFLKLPRRSKQIILFFVDLLNLYSAIYWAFVFRFNTLTPFHLFLDASYIPIYIFPIITIPLFIKTGLYRAVLKHIGARTLLSAFYSITISIVLLIVIMAVYHSERFPTDGILLATWFLSMFSTCYGLSTDKHRLK